MPALVDPPSVGEPLYATDSVCDADTLVNVTSGVQTPWSATVNPWLTPENPESEEDVIVAVPVPVKSVTMFPHAS